MPQDEIREILATHGRLGLDVADIANDADLYDAGLTSLITVNLLLAIEDHFDVEFPDELLSRRTFQTIDTLAEAVARLTTARASNPS
jgi:acyl carrier protein